MAKAGLKLLYGRFRHRSRRHQSLLYPDWIDSRRLLCDTRFADIRGSLPANFRPCALRRAQLKRQLYLADSDTESRVKAWRGARDGGRWQIAARASLMSLCSGSNTAGLSVALSNELCIHYFRLFRLSTRSEPCDYRIAWCTFYRASVGNHSRSTRFAFSFACFSRALVTSRLQKCRSCPFWLRLRHLLTLYLP